MNYYGSIYKITQITDQNGKKISYGPVLYYDGQIISRGFHRIGRAISIEHRLHNYFRNAGDPNWNYPFHNTLNKYKKVGTISKYFKIKILAICKTEREYKATEYFWTLYTNRKNNKEGFDLEMNQNFNPIIGSRFDEFEKLYLPKTKLTVDILKGFEFSDLELKYKSKKALELRLPKYYSKERDLFKIKAKLVAPYINKCLKRGFSREEAKKYLIESGFGMFDENLRSNLNHKNPKQNRESIEHLFNRVLDYIYGKPKNTPKVKVVNGT